MSNFCILRIKKLHTNANVGGALSHHLRTRETDNADPEKMKNNWFYPNSEFFENGKYNYEKQTDLEARKKIQQKTMAMYKKRLPEKVRKNGVRAVELMMTMSPEAMQKKGFNAVKYLNDCNKWAREKFGDENVFFVAQHYDEKTPHISILLTPIDEKGKLNARSYFGGREKMTAFQDEFYEKVGKKHDLDRGIKGSKAKHQTIKQYYEKINLQENQLGKLKEEIVFSKPEKKLFESNEEYNEKLVSHVEKKLDKIKPILKNAMLAEENEKRLKDLNVNFNSKLNNQVQEKVSEKMTSLEVIYEKRAAEEVAKKTAELTERNEMLEKQAEKLEERIAEEVAKKTAELTEQNKALEEKANHFTDFLKGKKYTFVIDGEDYICNYGVRSIKNAYDTLDRYENLTAYGLESVIKIMNARKFERLGDAEEYRRNNNIDKIYNIPEKNKNRGYDGYER
mgnify:CR=1 FL=1